MYITFFFQQNNDGREDAELVTVVDIIFDEVNKYGYIVKFFRVKPPFYLYAVVFLG